MIRNLTNTSTKVDETSTRTKVLCCAEIMANFLAHIFLQRPSLPVASHDAWMRYVQDHYSASRVVKEFVTERRYWYADAFLNFIDAVFLWGSRRATGRPETG
jgi:hypothetical protein